MGEAPIRVDFMTKITGVNYDDADREKVIAEIEGLRLPILHLNHLVISKISNRTKDKLDIEELQKIQQEKKRIKKFLKK